MIKKLWTRQWPFWLGGLFVGLAEIVFYYKYDMFIVVTTGFAQMYAVSEQYLFGIDWVARLYEPGIHWVIIGAVLGARLVAMAEGESRAWVHYNWPMLALSFVGGFLFSFGTRIAGGCTTHHFIGGLPSMSIASWVVLLSGIPFAFMAFGFAMKIKTGGYFRHQETWDIACRYHKHPDHPHPGYDPNYRPWRSPLHIFLTLFFLVFILLPVYFALSASGIETVYFDLFPHESELPAYLVWISSLFPYESEISGAVGDIGWENLVWLIASGLLLGFGIAKCGFGTECSVMAPESVFTKPDYFQKGGVPLSTYSMFRGMLPLQGFMVAIVVFNLFIMIRWMTGYGSVPNAAGEQGLYWGHILGGPLLATGAVFMIGCEVRTYARLGLGYATALAALPGFYLGYLPYTLFNEEIDAVVFGEGLTGFITLAEWGSSVIGGSETVWAMLYSLFLIGILVFSFGYGQRYLKTNLASLLTKNTDELVFR
uniref:Sulphur transport n=1 Tax=Candidatus Kentrum sp. FM TaxID=2126340 RepID=A0A450WJH7_9GAMM|nr:MAG: Sulphur transport [Candidatus Kentron sp. FM]VFJ72881.1 MAG: Sulphur transport [Candidatus Kentron sp. FM]VFK17185.1 MAG: Sulphur transport [Candidatus Kentron sp. FM]